MQTEFELISTDLQNNVRNRLFMSDSENITKNDILKIKTLCINKLGYGLKENVFIPNELAVFENLEACSFSGMKITNEILEAIAKLSKLKSIVFDFCSFDATLGIDIELERLYILNSNLGLIQAIRNKSGIRYLHINEVPENVDISLFEDANNLERLEIHNSKIVNSKIMQYFPKLVELNLDGSICDNDDIISNLEINVSKEEYFFYRG